MVWLKRTFAKMFAKLYRSVGGLFALLGIIFFLTIVLQTVMGSPVVAEGAFFASYGLAFGGCAFLGLGLMMIKGAEDTDFRFNAGKPLAIIFLGAVVMRILSLGHEAEFLSDTGWSIFTVEMITLMWVGEISLFALLALLFSRAK